MKGKFILALAFFLSAGLVQAQEQNSQNWQQEIAAFQQELNQEFADPERSPLTKVAQKKFTALAFFPADSSFRVKAKFVRTPDQLPFEMPTTTSRKAVYEKYGELHFILQGQPYVLTVFQNHALREKAGYEDYLFLPFTDATNGFTSYGGGRYLDLRIPKSDTILLDFNKAYNPFCAYNYNYSCPIPPKENRLELKVKAGVMAPKSE
ncbi:DUF1684 domain-containing protein [Pontibacter cellulosilyticus]|uniref:DUF1684 domain-containing protein n=1 Tax=Pontibacter cellulosilyticus TaxID=1720253 RepID=A0A923SHT0_9BACT|nr:DUF1684 domain-containing protein [Pontibacter cellulosilyticus]MBC5992018.1 DUF1684 domain-containing protein [Pontibacter cellulosilyticus]